MAALRRLPGESGDGAQNIERIRPLGSVPETAERGGRAGGAENSGCGQAAGSRDAQPVATAEQPFSRPASACLCVLRGTAAGQRPSPMQPRTERPAGRHAKSGSTAAPGPLRRLRRRCRRPSLQREARVRVSDWLGPSRRKGARQPWQAAAGRPGALLVRRTAEGPGPLRYPRTQPGQGIPRWLLPGGLTPPATLEFRLCLSKTRGLSAG